ncbi:hypothetical protein H4J38_15535 [Colwellia sp. BRX10-3]|uniref:hypothetical protein n=1 Tax=Colwellia sp. BRX10-3 TaxID=2759844 RepID=UPI0015F387D8|nr:hypothetical protein [Colwellia sp. BRX10-3]MBA6392181.1 hypothetical protein [Colwellia sp. BRX10-3]
MTERWYSEADKYRHVQILNLVSKKEKEYYYSFGYGALYLYLFLVGKNLESGVLLGVTNFLLLTSLVMWFRTIPIINKMEVNQLIEGTEPEDILSRHSTFSKISNKFGITSIVMMFIVNWVYIWN